MTSDVPVPPAAAGSPPMTEQGAPGRGKRRFRVRPKPVLLLLILAALLWFVLVNTSHMRIKLWVTTVSAPVWLVLLCMFAAGLLTGLLLAWRRRRPRRA